MKILLYEAGAPEAARVAELVRQQRSPVELTLAVNREAVLDALQRQRFDAVLAGAGLPEFAGAAAIALARSCDPGVPCIFLPDSDDEEAITRALDQGATDYVPKDRMRRLGVALARAARERASAGPLDWSGVLRDSAEAVAVTDAESKVIFWNRGAEVLFGIPLIEALQQPLAAVVGKKAGLNLGPGLAALAETGGWSGTWEGPDATGALRLVALRLSATTQPGGVACGRVLLASDVPARELVRRENRRAELPAREAVASEDEAAARKRFEDQLLRAQRMENIGLLAAGIAHDLNNMLAPILLAAPMLREYVGDPSGRRLLQTLEKSAERGANLVRQILAFAHGAEGEHRLLQPKHLLRDIMAVAAGTFPKSIRLEDHIPTDLWTVEGHPTQIHQVLLNLLVNARDAMPDGGVLRLRAGNLVLDGNAAAQIPNGRPGMFVVMQVQDNGTGIAPEVLAQMWQPFFTTKEANRGTGLGLSTVRGIIENHHGFIVVDTEVGRGSCFRVYLPAAESNVSEPLAPERSSTTPGRGELILVVDDERQVCEMMSIVLRRRGYRVVHAADGAEAAGVFAREAAEIRLVITDLHMPNVDGAMLARALRQMNPAIRILGISGMAGALAGGAAEPPVEFADAMLHKPFKPDALLAQVGKLLEPSAPVPPGT